MNLIRMDSSRGGKGMLSEFLVWGVLLLLDEFVIWNVHGM